jgi:hypothetical protein
VKGYDDALSLVDFTKDKTWPNDYPKAEVIWDRLWDAKERLDKFQLFCPEPDFNTEITEKLNELESCFYDLYGPGLYLSPEILVKRFNCSICNDNIKHAITLLEGFTMGTMQGNHCRCSISERLNCVITL